MCSMKKKSTTFSVEEQLKLLQLVESEKKIVENKTTNKIANEEKDAAWGRIAHAYNSTAVQYRTMDQLKSKFDNLKTKTRKVVAENRSFFKRTGGGGAAKPQYDAVVEAVLGIINPTTVFGLENGVDCDNDDNITDALKRHDDQDAVNVEKSIFNLNDTTDLTVENENTSDLNGFQSSSSSEDFLINNVETIIIDSEVQTHYNSARKRVTSGHEENVMKIKKGKNNHTQDLSSYTPSKLQAPVSKQLRPVRGNLEVAKEEYYKQKALNIQTEIWLKQEEEKRRAAEEERKIEEHERKIKLLDLEIKIKQRHLNTL